MAEHKCSFLQLPEKHARLIYTRLMKDGKWGGIDCAERDIFEPFEGILGDPELKRAPSPFRAHRGHFSKRLAL